MRCLIIDNASKIGQLLELTLKQKGHDVKKHDVILNERIEKTLVNLKTFCPEVVFDVAEYKNLDMAETKKGDCEYVNLTVAIMARKLAEMFNAKLLYLSSAHIFNGKKNGSYDILDMKDPQTVVGVTKSKGELEISNYDKTYIARTSWVVDDDTNFINEAINKIEQRGKASVICNQKTNPIFISDIVKELFVMSLQEKYGVYHLAGKSSCSPEDFLNEVIRLMNIKGVINGYDTEEVDLPARRIENMSLIGTKIDESGLYPIPEWHDAVTYYVHDQEYRKLIRKYKGSMK